ncbi:MAG: 30S ribosomal protein S4 [Candidatus Aenigmatarchaeota archaeon]
MKKQVAKFSTPLKPWNRERLEKEKVLLLNYGLRRKKEIWRAEGMLSEWRTRARDLRGKRDPEKEKILLDRLVKLGLLREGAGLEDVLKLKVENLMERRLQTVILRKGFATSAKQARQLIIHGHIAVDGKKVKWPSTLMPTVEDSKLAYAPKSKFKAAKEWAAGHKEKPAQPAPVEQPKKEGV